MTLAKRAIALVSVLVLVTLVWGSFVNAQNAASISGVVTDSSGGVVPGVEITIRQTATGIQREVVSGSDGRYLFSTLPVGPYEIRATLAGFRPVLRTGIVLTVAESATVDLVLEVGPADSEEILVEGGAPLVQRNRSDLSFLVSEETIEELPLNGRNFTDLALLQPGVVAFRNRDSGGSVVAHGLGTSVNGRDPRANTYLLDGTPQNDFMNSPASSAASTALGVETVQEFQVASNTYGAEFGRTYGGQINVVTKSGTNNVHGSVFYFHRNDALDARNFFDAEDQPEFRRHQFGATVGGPIVEDKWFYFIGYEGLRDSTGRSLTTVVPDDNARQGLIPDPDNPGELINVGVDPTVEPYLLEYPIANGPNLGGGLAVHDFLFDETLDQDFFQARIDRVLSGGDQVFARYTFDDAAIGLPTDYPQFPRAFLSRNQFFTAEYRRAFSPVTIGTFRGSYSRTNIHQDVEANTTNPLPPFVETRPLVGNIDVGGMPRFGPQLSVDVSLIQNVFGFDAGFTHARGRHFLKFGLLAERYQDNLFNPTFSLGIYNFASLENFLTNRPLRFIGLTPEGELDRYWRFSLFGFYIQDDIRVNPRLTVNLGLRYEFTTVPKETKGRDVSLPDLTASEPTIGPLYENPTLTNFAPRAGFAWDLFGDGKTALRGGYGLFYNTNNQQNLIVTITNPPFTPRLIVPNPTFPRPPFERGIGLSIRPIQFDIKTPSVHVWNLNLQRSLWADTVLTLGYAGSRGYDLYRSGDSNIPEPDILPDGSLFWPANSQRPNSAFSTIEEKTSDGESWYNALLVEVRKRFTDGFSFQSSYTFSRSIDTTQASTFFSDASNGTTSAFPEFGTNYNKGLSDFHAKHNWVFNFIWQIPFASDLSGWKRQVLDGWQLAGIANVQSGNPLTTFVQANRSRSRWSPSVRAGFGFDRPDLAPGFTPESAVLGSPDQYFDPNAFALQPAGRLGNLGRGALIGPNLRTFDLQAAKSFPFEMNGEEVKVQVRIEAFNIFNRANFAPPTLLAFSGVRDDESTLPTLGRIRSTVTSARQVQIGLKFIF